MARSWKIRLRNSLLFFISSPKHLLKSESSFRQVNLTFYKEGESSMTPSEGRLSSKGVFMEEIARVLTLLGLILQLIAVVLELSR